MAIPSWPTANNFPQVPQKGFTESIGVNVIRSAMDAGPAKSRFRGRKPSTMQVSFIMTTQQAAALETFVRDTLQGVKRFNFLHPRTNTTVEVRLIPQGEGDFFQLQYLAPGYWQTNLNLEILP